MASEMEPAKLALRSLLLSAPRGLSAAQIAGDWQVILYKACPFRELGFSSVEQMLEAMPDVAERNYSGIYTAVANKATAHIKELVDKQKKGKNSRTRGRQAAARAPRVFSAPTRRQPSATVRRQPAGSATFRDRLQFSSSNRPPSAASTQSSASCGLSAPRVPYGIREAMRKLLEMYPNGLPVEKVVSEFTSKVSKNGPLVPARMGFQSTEEFLTAMPDIVVLQQRSRGQVAYAKVTRRVPGPSTAPASSLSSFSSTSFHRPVENRPNPSSPGSTWLRVEHKGRVRAATPSDDSGNDHLAAAGGEAQGGGEGSFETWDGLEAALYGDELSTNNNDKTDSSNSMAASQTTSQTTRYPNRSPIATIALTTSQVSTTTTASVKMVTSSVTLSSSVTSPSSGSLGGPGNKSPPAAVPSAVPLELRKEIYQVLSRRPQGVFSARLPHEYKKAYMKELSYSANGFSSVVELADNMNDVCQITRPNVTGDWILLPTANPPQDVIVDYDATLKTMKHNVEEILSTVRQGIPVDELPAKYKMTYRQDLIPNALGLDMKALLDKLSSTVGIELSPSGRRQFACLRQSTPASWQQSSTATKSSAHSTATAMPRNNAGTSSGGKPLFSVAGSSISRSTGNRLASPVLPNSSHSVAAAALPMSHSQSGPSTGVRNIPCATLPAVEECVDVYVSHIVSPSLFYVQNTSVDELEEINHKMNELYNTPARRALSVTAERVSVGMTCCAMFDQTWYRAVVLDIIGLDRVKVFYIDYGNSETIPLTDICILRLEYRSLPAQAMKCKLAYIDPVNDQDWSTAACDRLKELAPENMILFMNVAMQTDDGGVLSVFLIDTSEQDDVNIGNRLVEQGLASFDFDSFHSSTPMDNQDAILANKMAGAVAGAVSNGGDLDDLEKLICAEVEDVSEDGDAGVCNGIVETDGDGDDEDDDDDIKVLTVLIDTLNVRRGRLLDSMKVTFSTEIVEEMKSLEAVIDVSVKRRDRMRADKKKRAAAAALEAATVTAVGTTVTASRSSSTAQYQQSGPF
eukprot:scpid13002/ scgid31240/ Tudor domain-containing protein 5